MDILARFESSMSNIYVLFDNPPPLNSSEEFVNP